MTKVVRVLSFMMPKRPSASLALIASMGLVGSSFFANPEPEYRDQVRTEFDVERLEAARRRRLNRRFKKQQQIARSKGLPAPEPPPIEETSRADVVLIGPAHSEAHLLASEISARRSLGPILIVPDEPVMPPSLAEALRNLHQSGLR